MKKKIYLLSFWAISLSSYSQIAINTFSSKSSLDVNGSLQVTEELLVGGNASTKGSAGNPKDILTSQGAGLPPLWKSLPDMNVPTIIYSTKTIYSASQRPTLAGYTFYSVNLPNDNLASNLIESVNSTTVRVKTTGCYLLTFNVNISVSETLTDGTAQSYISVNGGNSTDGELLKNSAYATAPNPISMNSTGILLLNANTDLSFVVVHTRNYRLEQYLATITFISNKL